ncbi:hypothetical protein [Roseiflexus sp.]|uniref:hypothetical protein n=1 Tax=Roseiflexus sp. TaxID=2562120 RepID=UPI0025EF34FC|nr:hypothetical protein [Roseiflexus sp.]
MHTQSLYTTFTNGCQYQTYPGYEMYRCRSPFRLIRRVAAAPRYRRTHLDAHPSIRLASAQPLRLEVWRKTGLK